MIPGLGLGADPVTFTAGVDLGGTKIQTVVLRRERVAGSARVQTPQTGDPEDVVAAIVETVRVATAEADVSVSDLRAIGIGTPGTVDPDTGAVLFAGNVPGFGARVELGPLVSRGLDGATVIVGNDVTAGVLGEHARGAGRPFRHLLGVWVGTGVGGGLVLDGELYEGRGAAGEIGHMVVEPDGRPCTCGRRGCLEAYAGRVGMERRARKLVERGRETSLFRIMEKRGRDRLTSGVYARALAGGDDLARELVDDAARALGIAIASAQNLLDLEAIVVGGGLADRLGRDFVDRVRAHMTPHLFVPDRAPAVLGTELGDLSGAVGAAVLAGG